MTPSCKARALSDSNGLRHARSERDIYVRENLIINRDIAAGLDRDRKRKGNFRDLILLIVPHARHFDFDETPILEFRHRASFPPAVNKCTALCLLTGVLLRRNHQCCNVSALILSEMTEDHHPGLLQARRATCLRRTRGSVLVLVGAGSCSRFGACLWCS